MTTRMPDPLRELADTLAGPTWAAALDLARLEHSAPLRAAAGGRGSVGAHSDPTATAAVHPTATPIPSPAQLWSALDSVATAVAAPTVPRAELAFVVAARLDAAMAAGPVHPITRRHGVTLLRLVDRCRTTPAQADRMIEEDQARERVAVGPTCCEACETPKPQCGTLRQGWCNACRQLWQRWQQSDGSLLGPGGRQHFAHRIQQSIVAGAIRRPNSPHRPGMRQDAMSHVLTSESSSSSPATQSPGDVARQGAP